MLLVSPLFQIPCLLLKSSKVHKYFESTEKNDIVQLLSRKERQLLSTSFFLCEGHYMFLLSVPMWRKWTPSKHAEWEHVLNINLKLFYLSQDSHLFFFFSSVWCLCFLFYYELFFFFIPTFCLCSCHCSYYYHNHNAINVEIFFNYYSVSVGY